MGPSIGPAVASPTTGAQNTLGEGARQFLEREARKKAAEEDAKIAAHKAANSRPEWMLVPPSLSNSASLQTVAGDPLKLKSRGFAQTTPRVSARGGGRANAEETDLSAWTETPEERRLRMQEQVSGLRATSGTSVNEMEALEKERGQRRDSIVAAAVAGERSAKKSLVEEHNERRKRELKDKLEDAARRDRRKEKRTRHDHDDGKSEKRSSRHSHSDDRDRRKRHRSRSSSPAARDKPKDRHERTHGRRSCRHDDSHRSHKSSRHRRSDDEQLGSRRKESYRSRSRSRSRSRDRDKDKDKDRHTHGGRDRERQSTKSRKQREEDEVRSGRAAAPMIWDRDAALSIGASLMDQTKRSKMMSDAHALGDRFGSGSRRFL